MREIKFRAWDGKKMILHDSLYEFQRQNRTQNELESITYLQYTGLKDKNGKEIYEGDIVRINIPVDENNPLITNGIFQVIFDKGMFCISIPEGNYPLSDYLHQDCEVIGNIYENPELLTYK